MKHIGAFCKGIHLLYVEDNEEARFFTLEFLSRFFDRITVATNGAEGLERFQNSFPELIISDINMPKMGGIEMAKEIRKSNASIPILILSAHSEESFQTSATGAGVDYYLAKPLALAEFVKVMQAVMDTFPQSTLPLTIQGVSDV